jgi:hypothetical protein
MIKLSSGRPIPKNEEGDRVVEKSKAHTILLLLLLCRHSSEADPDEVSSPWRDRPEVRSGRKSKDEYVEEIIRGIDLVPGEVLSVVLEEFAREGRTVKPSLTEVQTACRAAMQAMEDLGRL